MRAIAGGTRVTECSVMVDSDGGRQPWETVMGTVMGGGNSDGRQYFKVFHMRHQL